jgi:CCR4-NOT transcription complex subunit 7/8
MESIGLLEMAGIDFNKFKEKGIEFQTFAELFLNSGLVLNDNIHWITFHGSYDLAYLIKLVTGVNLPAKEEVFNENLNLYYPNFYDIKAVIQDLNINLKGTLSRIATDLGVRRVGNSHQAGSDSLITSKVFFQLITQYAEQVDLTLYKNKLFGLNNQSVDEFGQSAGNYNYYANNNMNMYGNKVQNGYKVANMNTNSYYPTTNGTNYNNNNFNSIWNNQGGYSNNMYANYDSVAPNNVNPYFPQQGLNDMYINNNIGYTMPQNLNKNTGSGGLKDPKSFNSYDPKMK